MLDVYDFGATLNQLDHISQWLNSFGFVALDRVRIYGRNIRKMLEAEASGGIEALQASMPLANAREILWSYSDADEFVRAVVALRNSLGDEAAAAPIKKALSGPADLFLENANNSAGRNLMFELIVAGRLAAAGFCPSFDRGPDVHVEFAGLPVAIQCKRPLSVAGLEKNIRKAIHQLEDGKAELNLIAVSVSRLLNAGDPDSIPEVPRHEHGHLFMEQRIQTIASQTERFWSGKMARAGILFYAFTPIRCHDQPRYFFDRCEAMFPLGSDELTSTLLRCFAQSLGR